LSTQDLLQSLQTPSGESSTEDRQYTASCKQRHTLNNQTSSKFISALCFSTLAVQGTLLCCKTPAAARQEHP